MAKALVLLLSLTCSAFAVSSTTPTLVTTTTTTTTITALATIDVCPQHAGRWPNVTVTTQYQPVTYCVASTKTKLGGKVVTRFPLKSVSTYVSTVIPCKFNGKTQHSCTITTTDQNVVCQRSRTVLTKETIVPETLVINNGTTITVEPSSTITGHTTLFTRYDAAFNQIGNFAIPDYQGCGICTGCTKDNHGVYTQSFNVTQCSWTAAKASKTCTTFCEEWFSTATISGPMSMPMWSNGVSATTYRRKRGDIVTVTAA